MNGFTRNLLILLVGLTLGISLTIGSGVLAERSNGSSAQLPLADIRALSEVFGKIKENYVVTIFIIMTQKRLQILNCANH